MVYISGVCIFVCFTKKWADEHLSFPSAIREYKEADSVPFAPHSIIPRPVIEASLPFFHSPLLIHLILSPPIFINSCSSNLCPPSPPPLCSPLPSPPFSTHFPRFIILAFSTPRRDWGCNIKAIHNLQHVLSSISMLCPSRRLPLLFHCSRMSFSCLKGYLSRSRASWLTRAPSDTLHAPPPAKP